MGMWVMRPVTFGAYANGATMGVGNAAPVGGKRGKVTGWSAAAVRRHKRWLYSIEAGGLSGQGDAVTLTLKRTPESPDEWQRLLVLLFQRFRKAGFVRWHWVVEWQRRGAPHVHLAVYADDVAAHRPGPVVVEAWLELAREYGARAGGQHVVAITGPVGWLQYLSKHASRGVQHYQRMGRPEGWDRTGRLWGKGGDWPSVEAVKGSLSGSEFWRVRRMVRSFAVAEARSRGDWRGVRYLRGMLRCGDRSLSTVRGVSEWVPYPVFLRMVEHAGWNGELVA